MAGRGWGAGFWRCGCLCMRCCISLLTVSRWLDGYGGVLLQRLHNWRGPLGRTLHWYLRTMGMFISFTLTVRSIAMPIEHCLASALLASFCDRER